MMSPDSTIYVAGHRGLVGSALVRVLDRKGYKNIVVQTHACLDLADSRAVSRFFSENAIEYVFLAAARVGGILANDTLPVEFIRNNLAIHLNVIDQAWAAGVKRLIFFGSSCIYPRECPQPIREEYLLTGPPEPTNSAYAISKLAGVELCRSYNQQYGTKYLAVMPANLYGPGDRYDPLHSHVLPSLIWKMHQAKVRADDDVMIWGTGKPRREFLFVDDLAAACVMLAQLDDATYDRVLSRWRYPVINIGSGVDVTISQLAEIVAAVVGFRGALRYDATKPDGTPRKLLDISQIVALGWRPRTVLLEGIDRTYKMLLKSDFFESSAV